MNQAPLSPEDTLNAYRCGLFPMAESADDDGFYWYDPPLRGQLSISDFHISRSLQRLLSKNEFAVTHDQAFAAVIDGCAAQTPGRQQTWINKPIRDLFVLLHEDGHAHSVEVWQGDELVGGVYGLAFGAVFAGESMFSRVPNASKVALCHLVARLWKGGFQVLDTQFVNDHLLQFGAYEISRDAYRAKIFEAGAVQADFSLRAFPTLSEKDLINQYIKK